MSDFRLDDAQARAVAAAPDTPLVICGAAGTGKTLALIERARRIAQSLPPGDRVWLTTPNRAGLAVLRSRLGAAAGDARIIVAGPAEFALSALHVIEPAAAIADDVFAAVAFETAAADLVDEAWTQGGDLDPEVSGIRSPQRFRAQAFRLFRKLRMNGIEPEAFEAASRRGLTQFYAHPPNFTSTKLLLRTQEQYRGFAVRRRP